ncbi:MAG TPA: hypothetical protein P5186_29060, partial [Candidatus Paceibacterota bacterium]|nr:hypothetical protein [Verrucomicrobiota bacterium]HRY52098.1 hypothetical protein [Candidatus Paceibacterota bacterium]
MQFYVQQTIAKDQVIAENRKQMDASAQAFLKICATFLDDQSKAQATLRRFLAGCPEALPRTLADAGDHMYAWLLTDSLFPQLRVRQEISYTFVALKLAW